MNTVEFKDLKDSATYIIHNCCSDCGAVIIDSKELKGSEIKKSWAMIVMGAELNTGRCPECSYSTYSDCNIHTEFKIEEVGR